MRLYKPWGLPRARICTVSSERKEMTGLGKSYYSFKCFMTNLDYIWAYTCSYSLVHVVTGAIHSACTWYLLYCQYFVAIPYSYTALLKDVLSTIDCVAGPSGLNLPPTGHDVAYTAIMEAGGGQSSNGGSSNGTPFRPRKRPRRPETWKRNVAKWKRVKGEEYVSPTTGIVVPARKTGPLCKCKKKCYELFSNDEKTEIIKAFNSLSNKELQDAHLFGLISSTEVKRRRPRGDSGKTRRATYIYHVSFLSQVTEYCL